MAIEDGLRYLYFSQDNRAANYTSQFTSWTASIMSTPSQPVVHLAGHSRARKSRPHVLDDPTQDIFQPVVQRGLNHIFNNLQQIALSLQNGNDPVRGCAGCADECVGLGA